MIKLQKVVLAHFGKRKSQIRSMLRICLIGVINNVSRELPKSSPYSKYGMYTTSLRICMKTESILQYASEDFGDFHKLEMSQLTQIKICSSINSLTTVQNRGIVRPNA